MSRRRYATWYRKLSKRDRLSYRRAASLSHDAGVRWVDRHFGEESMTYGEAKRRKTKRKKTTQRKKRRHGHHGPAPRVTRVQRKKIKRKIPILIREGYSPLQAAAIAYRMAGVGRKKKTRKRKHGGKRR